MHFFSCQFYSAFFLVNHCLISPICLVSIYSSLILSKNSLTYNETPFSMGKYINWFISSIFFFSWRYSFQSSSSFYSNWTSCSLGLFYSFCLGTFLYHNMGIPLSLSYISFSSSRCFGLPLLWTFWWLTSSHNFWEKECRGDIHPIYKSENFFILSLTWLYVSEPSLKIVSFRCWRLCNMSSLLVLLLKS